MIWVADHSPAAGFIDLCIVFNFDLGHKSAEAKRKCHPSHLLVLSPSDSALSFLSQSPLAHSSLMLLTLVTRINIWTGSWLSWLGKSAVLMYHFVCVSVSLECAFARVYLWSIVMSIRSTHRIWSWQGTRFTAVYVRFQVRLADPTIHQNRRSVERPVH